MATADHRLAFDSVTRAFLKALDSQGRRQILQLFSNGAELGVGDVASRLGIGQSTASEQLALLRDGALLVGRRRGKGMYYQVDEQGIDARLRELETQLRLLRPSHKPG